MRVTVAVFSLSILTPVAAVAGGPAQSRLPPEASAPPHCPRTTSYLAHDDQRYRDQPLLRKLTELPPATAYMAVYRRVDGCNDPLTMADYKQARRL